MAYLGNDLQVAYPTYKNIDDISGSFNSSTTSFPLLVNGVAPVPPPLNSQQCLISVGGVVQRPDDSGSEGFRLSGGNIIFASAPTTGADFFGVILAGADYINAGGAFPSGSGSVPSITFANDTDTGLFNYAPNEIGFGTGGVHHLTLTTAGQLANNLGSAAAPSYSFTGDLNTGIYSPGADQLALSTNGTGRLFVDASGRLGVGTASPAHALDVNGQLQAKGQFYLTDSSSNDILRITEIGASDVRLDSFNGTDFNGTIRLGAQTLIAETGTGGGLSERLRIDSSGRVGIGTSSPGSLLHVSGGQADIRLTDTNVTNATWRLLAQSGNTTKLFRIYDDSNSADRLVIDSSGRVGIGTTSPSEAFTLGSGNAQITGGQLAVGVLGTSGLQFINNGTFGTVDSNPLVFRTAATERARIDTSGRLLVGTSSGNGLFNGGTQNPQFQIEGTTGNTILASLTANRNDAAGPTFYLAHSRGTAAGGTTVLQSGDQCGILAFAGTDGTDYVTAATITAQVDGTPGANDMPGRLVFSTTADGASSPTERMRISSSGSALFNATSGDGASVVINNNIASTYGLSIYDNASSGWLARFYNNSAVISGSITRSGTTVAYNTSSDYRLKENVAPVTDGITRLQQLKPSRFNFIADPERTVDGFIAHEVQSVVPEAIHGTKDAVDDDGNPIYQGIDQSKLVPLLTAALQEAIGEIESLKARLDAANL